MKKGTGSCLFRLVPRPILFCIDRYGRLNTAQFTRDNFIFSKLGSDQSIYIGPGTSLRFLICQGILNLC